MRPLLLALALVACIVACKKDNDKEDVHGEYAACFLDNVPDSGQIAQHIIGNWKLNKQVCPMGPVMDLEKVKVRFASDNTFTVSENNVDVMQGTWEVQRYGGGGWSLNTSVGSQYLQGYILSCENYVIFISRPVDGCDSYFERIH